MKLATRIAVLTGAIAAATAFTSGLAGWRVMNSRLDAEIERSFDQASVGAFSNPRGMAELCELNNDRGRRRGPAPGVRRDMLINCVNRTGAVLGVGTNSSDQTAERIPMSSDMSDFLSYGQPGDQFDSKATISNETHRVRTVIINENKSGPTSEVRALVFARSVAEQQRLQSSLLSRLVAVALAGAVLASLLGWWLARKLTQPLQELSTAANLISSSGDLNTPINTARSHGEVSTLADSFRSMIESLRSSREAQARLVQDAGHELRTPLTSLRMNVELTALTNELVAVAGQTNDVEELITVDVVAAVDECVTRWRRRSDREIELTNLSQSIWINVESFGFSRSLDNLIANAVKFSPAEAPIEVVVDMLDAQVRVAVTDHGPGIAEHDMPFVFDRFYRNDAARSTPGSGLGLSIARDLVTAANGTIAASNRPTGGARFELLFPILGEP
jgi:two-component system, OmpR family, sensor histidine kinase MprB